jgi:hypothetical protein
MREQVTYMCRNPISCRRPGMRGFFSPRDGEFLSVLCRFVLFESTFYLVYISLSLSLGVATPMSISLDLGCISDKIYVDKVYDHHLE